MDCTEQHIPTIDLLINMLRVSTPLIGLPIVVVTGHTENALQCAGDKRHLTFDDLLRASIGVDSCGKPALRVKFIDSCDAQINCAVPTGFDQLRNMFAYDSTTKTYAVVLNQSS